MGAIKSRALALPNAFDRRCAHLARQTGPVIDHGVKLKVTGLSVGIGEIPQGTPAFGHGLGQHLPDGLVKPRSARFADAQGRRCRANTGQEQDFRRIDIADPHHHLARQ